MEFEIVSMNDKSSIPAPQGGTPGSSQSEVREKHTCTDDKCAGGLACKMYTTPECTTKRYVETVPQPQATQESTTWEEQFAVFYALGEKATRDFVELLVRENRKHVRETEVAQAKRQEGVRILEKIEEAFQEEAENNSGDLPYYRYLRRFQSDLTNIINNHE